PALSSPLCRPAVWGERAGPLRAHEREPGLGRQETLFPTPEAFSTGRGTLPQAIRISVSNSPGGGNTLSDGFAVLAALLREGPQEMLTMRA
ncbi:hypothetical protein I8S29_28640, partial [Klebsiella pneumoniae]|nr:hypothetical protein [Klebsiella pneumoniae]